MLLMLVTTAPGFSFWNAVRTSASSGALLAHAASTKVPNAKHASVREHVIGLLVRTPRSAASGA
jgi:hypothetical protein